MLIHSHSFKLTKINIFSVATMRHRVPGNEVTVENIRHKVPILRSLQSRGNGLLNSNDKYVEVVNYGSRGCHEVQNRTEREGNLIWASGQKSI